MSTTVRTRYAPSPTGFQHIGGIRTALFCYLYTRKMNGQMLLRIEDTDGSRFVPGAEEYIVESLAWCGIDLDEGPHIGGDYGPYRQSERKAIYQKYVQQLIDAGYAYYAFDTSEELTAMRERLQAAGGSSRMYDAASRMDMRNSLSLPADEVKQLLDSGAPYVVRIKVPIDEDVKMYDEVRGEVVINTKQVDDKVLLKTDGMPTYHMAVVVDDHLMKISHVFRGEEWLPSYPIHVLLYRFLGWEQPKFIHAPLILKPDGKGKLSKRAADKLGFSVFPLAWKHPIKDESSSGFREDGFFADAFINMLVFMGWNPGTTQEIFTRPELIEAFSLDRMQKGGAKFNFEKAQWFNQQYLQAKTDEELADLVLAAAPDAHKDADKTLVTKAVGLMKERMTFVKDFWENALFFFGEPASYDAKVVRKKWKEERIPLFKDLENRLGKLEEFSGEKVEKTVKDFIGETELGFGDVLQVFRVMLAGTMSGPSIFEMASILGREEVVCRMQSAAQAFDAMKAEA